jgi:hypothetical protein
MALARLAWAEQRDKAAMNYLESAVQAGKRMVEAIQLAYEQGTITLDVLLYAQGAQADAELILLHAGGSLPGPQLKRTLPWTLPKGEMPEAYPEVAGEPTISCATLQDVRALVSRVRDGDTPEEVTRKLGKPPFERKVDKDGTETMYWRFIYLSQDKAGFTLTEYEIYRAELRKGHRVSSAFLPRG